MIASVVLAVSVIAVGTALTVAAKQSAVVDADSTGLLLARQLMEEISARPFVDPTSGTPTSNSTAVTNAAAAAAAAVGSSTPARATYNDVGDYHGYTDTIDATHDAVSLQGKTASVSNGRKYTRAVTVEFRNSPSGSAVTTGDFALVTVTVTGPDGRGVSINRMFTKVTLLPGSTL